MGRDGLPEIFQPGDVIAFYGTGFVSRAIEWVTWGPSHVGIVCELKARCLRTDTGHKLVESDLVLIESTSLCERPCLIQRARVAGVQVHRPAERILDYDGRAKVFRLASMWRLNDFESDLLSRTLMALVGAHDTYDMLRAALSATRWAKWLTFPDPGSQFCSEMVAAALMRVGRLPVSDPAFFNPGGLCRSLRRAGVSGPLEMR